MVIGMAKKKITITLDASKLDAVHGLVDSGMASSVSGFIAHAVDVALDDVAGWGAVLAEALEATGGDLTEEERRWADRILSGDVKKGTAA
jgi:hypothetical protein